MGNVKISRVRKLTYWAVIISLLILVVMIWFIGPFFDIGDSRPLASVSSRLLAIVVIVTVFGLIIYLDIIHKKNSTNDSSQSVGVFKSEQLMRRLKTTLGLMAVAAMIYVSILVSTTALSQMALQTIPSTPTHCMTENGLGPEMILIPSGRFLMGSEKGRTVEQPLHEVVIQAFAMSRCEVSFTEYDLFVQETKRNLPYDSWSWGRGQRPVINVSWWDAQAYAAWLSEQTGYTYRLPTEAEWEYAARAGTTTAFSAGDCIHTNLANYNGIADYAGCGAKTGVFRGKTVAVGSLPANPWGLFEMHGNVWEWTQDCRYDDYKGAPTDGSAWESKGKGDCSRRTNRGGSWNSRPGSLQSSIRSGNEPDYDSEDLGFRLARTL